jgi:CAP-Gly domain-containing linker protein 3/4
VLSRFYCIYFLSFSLAGIQSEPMKMTQGRETPSSPMSRMTPSPLRTSSATPDHGKAPVVHSAVDAPICADCMRNDPAFCDPNCPECEKILLSSSTSIAQLFAVLRQWTPQTQQNLEIIVREVSPFTSYSSTFSYGN